MEVLLTLLGLSLIVVYIASLVGLVLFLVDHRHDFYEGKRGRFAKFGLKAYVVLMILSVLSIPFTLAVL